MKKLALLIPVLVSVLSITAQSKQPDLAKSNLVGNVKSVDEITYTAKEKFGEPVKEAKSLRKYETFSKAGFVTGSVLQSLDDKKWKITSSYKYDQNNNITEERTEEDGEVQVIKAQYNANGDMQEVNVFDKKGNLEMRHKFSYEPGESENIFMQTLNTRSIYNGEGELIKKVRFNSAFTITENVKARKTETEYMEKDSRGNITLRKTWNDKDSTTLACTYNSQGWQIEKSYRHNNSKPTITNYVHDARGNVIKETDSYGNVKTSAYTYDDKGNWVKRIDKEVSYGTTYSILEREIKYY